MSIAHHPEFSTLMAFGAGTLDEAYATVIATHAAMCPACRQQVWRIEGIGGALLDDLPDASLDDGAIDRLLEAVDEEPEPPSRREPLAGSLPEPLARYLPNGLDAIKWKFSGPGVGLFDIATDDRTKGRLLLLRVAAGRRVPEHSHGGQELTLILKGAYRDRFGVFATGDVADHGEEVEHQPIAEPGDDCICLVALDAKLSFRSRIVSAIQPFFGL